MARRWSFPTPRQHEQAGGCCGRERQASEEPAELDQAQLGDHPEQEPAGQAGTGEAHDALVAAIRRRTVEIEARHAGKHVKSRAPGEAGCSEPNQSDPQLSHVRGWPPSQILQDIKQVKEDLDGAELAPVSPAPIPRGRQHQAQSQRWRGCPRQAPALGTDP